MGRHSCFPFPRKIEVRIDKRYPNYRITTILKNKARLTYGTDHSPNTRIEQL